MKRHLRCLSLLFLCAILLLSFIFVLYFPCHHCTPGECTVCALIDHATAALAFLLLPAVMGQPDKPKRLYRALDRRGDHHQGTSPVHLKVKLSN